MVEHDRIVEFIHEQPYEVQKDKSKKRLIVSQSIFFNLIKEATENFNMPTMPIGEIWTYNFYGYEIVNGQCENPLYQLMIEKFIETESKLNFIPKNDYHIFFSLSAWKKFRGAGISIAQWTDKELDNRNKETGLIGMKEGIECYVLKKYFS